MRAYSKADIPQLVDLCIREVPKLDTYKNWPINSVRLRYLLVNNVNNATFLCLVACDSQDGHIVGGISALTSLCFFNDYVIASDIFLFVEPEYRTLWLADQLIDRYVLWAKARGAKLITASQTSGYRAELMERMLTRHKFSKVGSVFHMEV